MDKQRIREIIIEEISRNYISDVKGSTANKKCLVSVNESNVQRMLEKHSQNGYAIVSACRGENTPKENDELTRELINDISKAGFSFTPMYGGFKENLGTDDEVEVVEKSVMIFNYDRNGNPRNMEDLAEFAKEMCGKYGQDSVLVKTSEGNPQYITQDGSVDMEFGGGIKYNDPTQEYFSDRYKGSMKSVASPLERGKQGGLKGAKQRRFSLEYFVNPSPNTLNEAHVRHLKGEVFIPYRG